jgi:hypothetical protein
MDEGGGFACRHWSGVAANLTFVLLGAVDLARPRGKTE